MDIDRVPQERSATERMSPESVLPKAVIARKPPITSTPLTWYGNLSGDDDDDNPRYDATTSVKGNRGSILDGEPRQEEEKEMGDEDKDESISAEPKWEACDEQTASTDDDDDKKKRKRRIQNRPNRKQKHLKPKRRKKIKQEKEAAERKNKLDIPETVDKLDPKATCGAVVNLRRGT
ncbi:hypothetical protein HDU96_003979 [Phlyctochytrium bullatum]|nr:hypothetical protein HDU96_003979 [Phlyctochytrium bullatum]